MDEDLEHLERHLHSVVAVARTLARDVDAIDGELWHEPYAYQAAAAAIAAARNMRRQLETRWLVTPLDRERPRDEDDPQSQSYPHVIDDGGSRQRSRRAAR
jgi:hypothetical protein